MKIFKRTIALFLSVVSLLLCACGDTSVIEPTPEPTAEPLAFSDDPNAITEASANIVMLTTYDKNGEIYMTGSGFPAFEDGYIVTNYHVIEGADRIEGNTESEMYFKIDEIVAADTERDIAILKTNAKTGLTPLTLGDTSVLQKGEKVVAIGSPLGLINTVSDGIYSNRRTEDGREYLQFTAAISPGSSGGALFNDKGEVIGITSASYTEGQNLNLAIPSEVVQDVWNNKETNKENTEQSDSFNVDEINELGDEYLGLDIKVTGYISSIYRKTNIYGEVYATNFYLCDDPSSVIGIDYTGFDEKGSVFSKEFERIKSKKVVYVENYHYTIDSSKELELLEEYQIGEKVTLSGELEHYSNIYGETKGYTLFHKKWLLEETVVK